MALISFYLTSKGSMPGSFPQNVQSQAEESASCERHRKVFSKASPDGQIPQVASTGLTCLPVTLAILAPIDVEFEETTADTNL